MDLSRFIDKLKTGSDLKIVALGDSLTYGWMVEKGYLVYLKEMLRSKYPRSILTIMNRGIPGDTAAGGLERLQDQVVDSNPDLVLVQFGLNDAFSGYSVAEFRGNITGIIAGLRAGTAAEIVLLTSSALDENEQQIVNPYYVCLQDISDREEIPIALVDAYWKKKISAGLDFSTLVQADRVHPTSDGYRLMAEALVALMLSDG